MNSTLGYHELPAFSHLTLSAEVCHAGYFPKLPVPNKLPRMQFNDLATPAKLAKEPQNCISPRGCSCVADSAGAHCSRPGVLTISWMCFVSLAHTQYWNPPCNDTGMSDLGSATFQERRWQEKSFLWPWFMVEKAQRSNQIMQVGLKSRSHGSRMHGQTRGDMNAYESSVGPRPNVEHDEHFEHLP